MKKIFYLITVISLFSITSFSDSVKVCFEYQTVYKKVNTIQDDWEKDDKRVQPETQGEGEWIVSDKNQVVRPVPVYIRILKQKPCKMVEAANTLGTQQALSRLVLDALSVSRVKEEQHKKNIGEMQGKYAIAKDGDIVKLFNDKEFEKLAKEIDDRRDNLDAYMRNLNALNKLYNLYGETNMNSNNDVGRLNAYRKDLNKAMFEFSKKIESDYITSKVDSKNIDKKLKDKKYSEINYRDLSLYKFSKMLNKFSKSKSLSQNHYNLYLLMNENIAALDYMGRILNNMSRNLDFDMLELSRLKQSELNRVARDNTVLSSAVSRSFKELEAYKSGKMKDLPKKDIQRLKDMYGTNKDDVIKEVMGW